MPSCACMRLLSPTASACPSLQAVEQLCSWGSLNFSFLPESRKSVAVKSLFCAFVQRFTPECFTKNPHNRVTVQFKPRLHKRGRVLPCLVLVPACRWIAGGRQETGVTASAVKPGPSARWPLHFLLL